jgi:hypothetical protein
MPAIHAGKTLACCDPCCIFEMSGCNFHLAIRGGLIAPDDILTKPNRYPVYPLLRTGLLI